MNTFGRTFLWTLSFCEVKCHLSYRLFLALPSQKLTLEVRINVQGEGWRDISAPVDFSLWTLQVGGLSRWIRNLMMKSGLIPRVPWFPPQNIGTRSTMLTMIQDEAASLGNSQPPRILSGCLFSLEICHEKYHFSNYFDFGTTCLVSSFMISYF